MENKSDWKSRWHELLQSSFKSNDTEEWLDVHFTRPIGLAFALLWNKLGVHPNAITILSIFLGIGAGCMFYFTDLWHNLCGVVLLMLANFCDSTDGQMARLTGKKTLVGRVLDGFSGDVWFFCIYVALSLRLMPQNIPFTNQTWGIWIWLLAFCAGVLCHSPQSSLSDYYRQIHLFFLKGKEGSELDNYLQQRKEYEQAKQEGRLFAQLFYYNYANYCKSQEKRTPHFQSFFQAWHAADSDAKAAVRPKFLEQSRPLMPFTNILTFNTRAICIYATCLLNIPWLYMLIEITVLQALYVFMHKRHENLCANLEKQILAENEKD